MSRLWPYVAGVDASEYNTFFHSDQEGPDTVPWTGLESVTRAYAKIVDGVNRLDLSALVLPPEPGYSLPIAQGCSNPLIRGEFERGEIARNTGLPERSARRVLNEVIQLCYYEQR